MQINKLIRIVVLGVLALVFTVQPVPVSAEQHFEYSDQFEYKEYIVKPGDTLWSISRRELEDGFQWPMVWRENLKINNPDQISPGQIIIIPIRVIETDDIKPEAVVIEDGPADMVSREMEMPEEPEQLPVIEDVPLEQVMGKVITKDLARKPIDPLISNDLLVAAGYITRVMPDAGEIEGHAYGRMAYGEGDEIYIQTKERSRPGQKFYIVKNEAEVRHPVTKKKFGYLAKVAGVVVAEESGRRGLKARVIQSYDLVEVGDKLDYYYEIPTPFLTGPPRRPRVDGHVIAANHMRIITGTFDIVFLDKGSKEGLRTGDVLMTLFPGTDDRMTSVVQVVNVRKETSLGIILKSVSEVTRGDVFTGIQ